MLCYGFSIQLTTASIQRWFKFPVIYERGLKEATKGRNVHRLFFLELRGNSYKPKKMKNLNSYERQSKEKYHKELNIIIILDLDENARGYYYLG